MMVSNKKDMEELPVDRGWAWVICAAAFVCIFLIGSSLQVLSVLFLDLVSEFHTSVTTTSFAVMFYILALSFSSVLSSNYFVPRFDERRVTSVAGALFSSSSIGLYLAPNIGTFIVFSAMQGLCAGMIFIPSISIISYYFSKYRSIATTISNSGLCVAPIVGPPVIRAISREFGLKGTFLILAGIYLHMIPAGLLLRPVSSYKPPKELYEEQTNDTEELKHKLIDQKDSNLNSPNVSHKKQITGINLNDDIITASANSDGDIPMKSNFHDQSNFEVNDSCSSDRQVNQRFQRMDSAATDVPVSTATRDIQGQKGRTPYQRSVSQFARRDTFFWQRRNTRSSIDGNMSGVFPGSVLSITSALEAGTVGVAMQLDLADEESKEAEIEDGGCKSNCCCQLLYRIFDPSLLSLWTVRLYLLSCIPASTNQYIFQYIPTIAVKQGATKDQSAMLLTITGSVDLASRLMLGVFADTHLVSSTHIVCTSLVCLGILCQFYPLFTSYEPLIAMAVLMGLFIGTRMSQLPLTLIEIVGMEKMSRCLSLATMVSTISAACHNPFLSAVMEATGTFQIVLHYCGGALILGGFLLLLIPLAQKLDNRKNADEPEV